MINTYCSLAELYGSYIWEVIYKPAISSSMKKYIRYLNELTSNKDNTKLCFAIKPDFETLDKLYFEFNLKFNLNDFSKKFDSPEELAFWLFEKIMNSDYFKTHENEKDMSYYLYNRLCKLFIYPKSYTEMIQFADEEEYSGIDHDYFIPYIWVDGTVFVFSCPLSEESLWIDQLKQSKNFTIAKRNLFMSFVLSDWWRKGHMPTNDEIFIDGIVSEKVNLCKLVYNRNYLSKSA